MNKAVFLDRDGTIIKDRGHINNMKDIIFYNYTFDCLKELQKDFLLFIITNQPGVAKGIIKVDSLNRIHSNILHKMSDHGIDIKEIYCCTHRKEDNCLCRKPGTFFIDSSKDKFVMVVAPGHAHLTAIKILHRVSFLAPRQIVFPLQRGQCPLPTL